MYVSIVHSCIMFTTTVIIIIIMIPLCTFKDALERSIERVVGVTWVAYRNVRARPEVT